LPNVLNIDYPSNGTRTVFWILHRSNRYADAKWRILRPAGEVDGRCDETPLH
jgi:hypothetical protein